MTWIEPLQFATYLIGIFSGELKIFTIIALIAIIAMSAFFRMTMLTMFFSVGLFLIMFQSYVDETLYFLLITIGGLLAGYVVAKFIK